jgi:F-type H+-transporting ATPase subunit epsilon
MDSTIQCDIVSTREQIFSGEITLFIAIGSEGELGIAPRHAPLITTLKAGPLRLLLPSGEETVFVIGGGILEVMPHLVSVLADSAIRATDIDKAAALQAQQEAERALRTSKRRMEITEAEAQLRMAIAELRQLDKMRKEGRRGRRLQGS